jgi:hypothetical protein
MAKNDSDKTPKQPFVAQADRPDVRLKSDTPLNELTVRDLATILGQVGQTGKDFWDGKAWQKDDFDGTNKPWKEGKEEIKDGKDIKDGKEIKDKEKREKPEKSEIKELKAEKLESDGVFEPVARPGPDPRLDQVIQALSGLSARVAQLANQVDELKKASKG